MTSISLIGILVSYHTYVSPDIFGEEIRTRSKLRNPRTFFIKYNNGLFIILCTLFARGDHSTDTSDGGIQSNNMIPGIIRTYTAHTRARTR